MIKYNSSEIIECYLGNNMLDSIYKGSNLIWSAAPSDYSTIPLTIESLEDNNTITIKSNGFSDTINMIINVPQWGDMAFWISPNTINNIITLNRGEKIQIKEGWPTSTVNNFLIIGSSGKFNVYGNIMSVFGENNGSYNIPLFSTYQFMYMFKQSQVVDASNLILPFNTTNYCYNNMFRECGELTDAPKLPAIALSANCYSYMFYGCRSLTTAPELPAEVASKCYEYMFAYCSSLNYIKAMFTMTPSTLYTRSWVVGVASSGTFIKNTYATWNVTGNNGVPSGWTIQYASS